MNKQIVIINGSGGCGKDTFVSFCSKYAKVMNYSSVQEIKEIAAQLGWQGGKTDRDRKFLSDLKLLSSDYSDFPYYCICNAIKNFEASDKELMFIHIRDIPEIARLETEFPNIKTLLVRNSNVPVIATNVADANVENYLYNYNINNDGTLEDLDIAAKNFTTLLLGNNI